MPERRKITLFGRIFRVMIGYLPACVVLVGSVGLWCLWPQENVRARGSDRTVSKTYYAFVSKSGSTLPAWRRPDMFVNAAIAGAGTPEPSDQFVLTQEEPETKVSRYLSKDVIGDTLTQSAVSKADISTEFHPIVSLKPVFRNKAVTDSVVTIRMSDAIMDAGLVLPGLELDQALGLPSWQIILEVNIAKDGTVSDVFVEQGTGNVKLDESLVRQIYTAKAENPSGPATGRIFINKSR